MTEDEAQARLVDAAPSSAVAFLAAWVVFWLLLLTLAIQEQLRGGHGAIWQPLLWEGSSCLVASGIVALLWRQLPLLDRLLAQPLRWFAACLVWLPLATIGFVAAIYAIRHGVYAAFGSSYQHAPWSQVIQYESLKFSLFSLMFIAILFGLRSHAALGVARLKVERLLRLTQQAQLQQLTQQIEPHFLFNALNTIASSIHANPDLADTLVLRLSALLRAATDLTRRSEVTLDEELTLLQAFVDIMQARFAPRTMVHWDIDENSRRCMVPTLLLQPLAENAYRHGLAAIGTAPALLTISLRSRRLGDRLQLEVVDDQGQMPEPLADGVGLANLRQRLALLHQQAATLELVPRNGGGVVARIELPCGC